MTKAEFEVIRDELLDESLEKREIEYKKACADGRCGRGLGHDTPEMRAITREYAHRIADLWKTVEDK